jgi:hypothetical protein
MRRCHGYFHSILLGGDFKDHVPGEIIAAFMKFRDAVPADNAAGFPEGPARFKDPSL